MWAAEILPRDLTNLLRGNSSVNGGVCVLLMTVPSERPAGSVLWETFEVPTVVAVLLRPSISSTAPTLSRVRDLSRDEVDGGIVSDTRENCNLLGASSGANELTKNTHTHKHTQTYRRRLRP